MPCRIPRGSLRRFRRRKRAGPSSVGRGSARRRPRKRTSGSVVVLSAGGGGGSEGGGCRRRDLERRTGGGRGVPCLATISSSVAGSAGGCGPVVGLPSYKKRQGSVSVWSRGSRGRGRGRGGGANLFGSGVAPANYAPGLQGVAPGLREVVNILGKRNQAGTLSGVGPPPGTLDNDSEEEGTSTKRPPPRPLYRRLINYVRQAWTGVKFALDSEYEEEQIPRYRPDSLASLCRATRFTEAELKRIYRGFKAECPTGVVREDTFKCIYSQFFPQGANTSQYAHYVFNTLDQDHSGLLSFEDFVTGLSILSRGSIDEKLRWTFSLYDINGDGCITREEMTDIVTAVYELMGKFSDPNLDHEGVREKVDRMFQKMDGNRDGVVTLSEFLEACRADPDISTSMAALDTAF
ncbi:PREDICTED: Kv channel-interacting protein 4 isoform X1 [Wasmannia auropunctata]|uniref:Kv channel-interacting protein 4 isoform X1 n=1 Tax=Wasmannia auropunctata TaxID=64793 RepID=UPI0005ED74B8|nr:PREDICTED: Kv channel-interacting protein 4 isoform X1 [Wasmannia auropunctata]